MKNNPLEKSNGLFLLPKFGIFFIEKYLITFYNCFNKCELI